MEELLKSLEEQGLLVEESMTHTIKTMEVFIDMITDVRNNKELDIEKVAKEMDGYEVFDRINTLASKLEGML